MSACLTREKSQLAFSPQASWRSPPQVEIEEHRIQCTVEAALTQALPATLGTPPLLTGNAIETNQQTVLVLTIFMHRTRKGAVRKIRNGFLRDF